MLSFLPIILFYNSSNAQIASIECNNRIGQKQVKKFLQTGENLQNTFLVLFQVFKTFGARVSSEQVTYF